VADGVVADVAVMDGKARARGFRYRVEHEAFGVLYFKALTEIGPFLREQYPEAGGVRAVVLWGAAGGGAGVAPKDFLPICLRGQDL
jgi:hypothetical protein